MEAKTLEALNESIAKWEANAKADAPEDYLTGVGDCPLCQLFNSTATTYGTACRGCPVMDSTGEDCCNGTPYDAASFLHRIWRRNGTRKARADAREAAVSEVEFLKSLLPETATP